MGLTRREVLSRAFLVGGAAGVTLILQACGSAPSTSSPAPTSAPAPAAAPTAAKAASTQASAASASPTPIPALQVVGTVSASQEKVPGPDIVVMPPKSAQPVTLRFHMRTGGEKSEPGIYVSRPQEWEQATGNKVTLEPIPGDANYVPKLETLAAAGTIGDLTWASDGHNEFRHLVQFKVLEPLDNYLQKANQPKTQWLKPVLDTLSMDGKFWAIPKAGYPGYSWIWVNLKMFKDAGIDEPPVYGTTHDQLAEWANKLSKGSKDRRDVYGLSLYVTGNYGATNGVRQFGGDLISADGTQSLVNQKPFLDWLQWAQKLITVDKVHPFTQDIPSGGLQGMFAAEKVAMVENDRSFQFQVRNAVKDKFPWKVIAYPHPANSKGYCAIVAGHAMTSASKYKDTAFSFVYSIGDQRFTYIMGKTQGYLPGRVDDLEDLGPYANDPFIQLQYKNSTLESAMWLAKNLRAFDIDTTLSNQLDLVWLGKAQPNQAFADDLKKQLDAVLARPE